MTAARIITKKITSQVNASVISTNANTQLGQSLWAINWFDLKRGWLYEWYNRLAFSHVKSVGARPVFKGKLIRTIIDNERLRREMLLIVNYPKASAFLDMIASKLFQIKSLIRTSSVAHFQFGFMQKISPGEPKMTKLKYEGKLKYLVHVCEDAASIDIKSLIEYAATMEVYPHFFGQKSAIVGFQKRRGNLKTLDFILSHVLVFSGFDYEALEAFTHTTHYQKIIQSSKSHFVGLYDRKI